MNHYVRRTGQKKCHHQVDWQVDYTFDRRELDTSERLDVFVVAWDEGIPIHIPNALQGHLKELKSNLCACAYLPVLDRYVKRQTRWTRHLGTRKSRTQNYKTSKHGAGQFFSPLNDQATGTEEAELIQGA
jgi:hypothetical protein